VPELGSLGSVRGAFSNERPYRECAIPRFLNQAVILKINLACVCREIGIAARCAR
jgi:hypothetical protein